MDDGAERGEGGSVSPSSSDAALSPLSDSASTGSAVPTPPELESPIEREAPVGSSRSPETVADELQDDHYIFAEPQSPDLGLQMKAHRRFWSQPPARIDEEEAL